jgi:ABC-2 type transport system permease protein
MTAMTLTYTRYELLRAFRSTRFFAFSLGFPIVMFFLIAGPNRDEQLDGVPFPLYYMAGMAAWGTMAAVLSSGARIAGERAVGWHRQLRITPLPAAAYFRTKVLTGYAMAVLTLVSLYACGTVLGVRLDASSWLSMTALVLVGLVPFAVLGILFGHLLTVDAIGPAMGGSTALLGLIGGSWGPVGGGFLRHVSELVPSYWLVQAGRTAYLGGDWPLRAWLVVAGWTVVLLRITAVVHRRDTARL